jgi:acetyltransferase-like isoleucine patch superfamily enzyme
VSPRATIVGGENIQLGHQTVVHDQSILCAASLDDLGGIGIRPSGMITIGPNCLILPGAILATYGGNISVGSNVSVNPYTVLYGHGGLRVGNDVRIAAHVTVIPANHTFDDPTIPIRRQRLVSRGIVIEFSTGQLSGAGRLWRQVRS